MKLWEGEEFYLQIDSHHRFEYDWDEFLLKATTRAPCEKSIITTYCPSYDPMNEYNRCTAPTKIEFSHFTDDGIPLFKPSFVKRAHIRGALTAGRFISAHFIFTIGKFVELVPYDPNLYFHGEEITITIRAYTNGFDIFHPMKTVLWHEYSRSYRPKHWDDHANKTDATPTWWELDRNSRHMVSKFLERPGVGTYSCGLDRTFEEYCAYAGLELTKGKPACVVNWQTGKLIV